MNLELSRSDWVGVGVGAAVGLYQGIALFDSEIGLAFENIGILPLLLFGLLSPPVLVLLNKFSPTSMLGIYRKIGNYINVIFSMVAFGIFTGISGFTYYWLAGGSASSLPMLAFFSSAGVGFCLAHFINPELGRPKAQS